MGAFAAYLALIFVFAWFYNWLYQYDHDNFSVNPAIQNKSQRLKNEPISKLENEAHSLSETLDLLNKFRDKLPDLEPDSLFSKHVYPSGLAFELDGNSFVFRQPLPEELEVNSDAEDGIFMEVRNPRGHGRTYFGMIRYQIWSSKAQTVTDNKDILRQVVADCISKAEQKATEIRNQLSHLYPQRYLLWSYWDFLYFSAITTGTVGYGDILPNSTPVRMVVVAQVLLSAFLLLFVINIILSG